MRGKTRLFYRAAKWTVAGIVTVAVILLLKCFADHQIKGYELYVRSYLWGREPFDVSNWKRLHPEDEALSPKEQDTRGRMIFSLLTDHRLGRLTRLEVEKLIGPAETADGGYWIGNQTGFKIDPDILYISYDSSGRVSDFHTEQH
jgi:hypothetical protein